MSKLKLAFYWAASCGGCEIAQLEIGEKILKLAEAADIVFWPVAIDVKYKDVEAMPNKSIDVCLFNGAIRNSEQEHMARMLREKSKILIAYGSCAYEGCIPGLANMFNRQPVNRQQRPNFPPNNLPGPRRRTYSPRVLGYCSESAPDSGGRLYYPWLSPGGKDKMVSFRSFN